MNEKIVIKRLVLDVLKPHKPSVISVGKELSALKGVSGCNITLIEIDKSVENVKVTIEGDDINYQKLEQLLEENGATIHSIDSASVGKKTKNIVEEVDSKTRIQSLR